MKHLFLTLLSFIAFFRLATPSPLSPGDAETLCAIIKAINGLPGDWACPNEQAVIDGACNKPWSGLTCTNPGNTTASITALDLSGVSGQVPPEIGLLDELRSLKLAGTGLKGPMPDTFNNLRYLITMDISGTSISGGCFPQALINNEVFSNCRAAATSFSCACDAPPMCRAKSCCPSVGGLEEAGLICTEGKWVVPDGASVTVEKVYLQDEEISLATDVNITGHLELRKASLAVDGDLTIQAEEVVIAGLASNLTITGCLTILGESTLILQLLEEDTVTPNLEWTFIRVKDDCIKGDWKEIIVESIAYDGCLKTDTQNITHPGSIILSVSGECSTPFPKEAVLGIVFGLIIAAILIGTVFYIFNNQEAYEYVFPDRVYKSISNPENF